MAESMLHPGTDAIVSNPAGLRIQWRNPAATAAAAICATLLVAVCAHISIPLGFTPIPLTMQTFAVLVIGLLFGPGAAFASLSLYLLEGAAGLPVFTPHGPGGVLQVLGPTGGYLLAYPLAAAFVSILFRRTSPSFMSAAAAAAAGSVVILALGAAWMTVLTRASVPVILAQTVVPFIPGDLLKLLAAAGCATGWQRLRRRFSR